MNKPKTKSGGKPRRCVLQNLKSGRVVKASSITDFCRKARLGAGSKLYITPVLDGKRSHHKGWYLPTVLNETIALKDVYGRRYETDANELLNRKKLSMTAITRLKNGRVQQGLSLLSTETAPFIPPRPYRVTGYVLKDQAGETFEGVTMREVAELAGISHVGAFKLVHGHQDMVKGVYLKRVKTEERSVLSL